MPNERPPRVYIETEMERRCGYRMDNGVIIVWIIRVDIAWIMA